MADLCGLKVFVDHNVPPEAFFLVQPGKVYMHPRTWELFRPVPLWTQYTLGTQEARRDRRRYA